ncbi:Tetracycline resistance protein TetB/drug resistance transporter [Neofusicoccum parvum]|uniref:Putative multidrug resistance protein fnx1 protein n=1 Tax=Botryosphaeria parva (strain UCR-NP2) TaxID=1287680 RepID=R1GT61_BOTPV|nr:putative multidrug resistance protein fnx1 protein [Neofusicoccum parvum UCRNP2]GME56051.1 Tetracycline resistance protein TetB/drug resistance transporter [Neofusicoccum parvum]
MVYASLCFVTFLSALDSTVITIALPTISRSLDSNQYVWIVNTYSLSCAVFLVVVGQLADFFDRKPIILTCVLLYGTGSTVCAASQTMGMMIGGRIIQGIGGGGAPVMAEIICSDMVALEDRPKFLGILAMVSAVGGVVGPPIGSAIIAGTTWRWIFYINLPLSVFTVVFLFFVVTPQTPGLAATRLSLPEKLRRLDWIGNVIFAGSSTALLYGLITGGNVHPWKSANVILAIIFGGLGFIALHWYESSDKAAHPVMPPKLVSNRTAIALNMLACLVLLLLTWTNYFLPVYFQAVLQASPGRSSVLLLPTSLTPLFFGMVGAVLMSVFKRAREIHMAGAAVMSVGFGVFALFDSTTSLAARVGVQAAQAAGAGILVSTILPALQAQLPQSDVAAATALFNFMRSLGSVWGVTIPSVIFNACIDNGLTSVGDVTVRNSLKNGAAYGKASADFIKSLTADTRVEVVALYVSSLRVNWFVAMAVALVAFILACSEKHIDIKPGREREGDARRLLSTSQAS